MLKGNESMVDALLFAFGLENGSSEFYTKAAAKIEDPAGKELFLAMSEVEKGHMADIRLLYCGLDNEACPISMEEFRDAARGPYIEGGRLIEAALAELDVAFLDELDALKVAIKHEGEAYGFYTKASKRMEDGMVRVLFENLAAEEKKHLDALTEKLKKARQES
ncbi:MAG: ferritin family protein [Nitrospirota bacterium]